jgi:serine/threonine protein kinase
VDDSYNARLCDFGRAKVIGDAEYSTALVAGCAPYMAPELFPEDERIVDQLFSPSSDIYAFGMLAFEVNLYFETSCSIVHCVHQMFTDEVPFNSLGALSQFRIMASVLRGDRPSRSSDVQRRISDTMWEIMRDSWAADPMERPTAAMILQRIG